MSKLDWKPIRRQAQDSAEAFGHKLGAFTTRPSAPSVQTAICETCYGCCWVAYSPTRGFTAGGRLLFHACGTKEAKGVW